MRRSFWYTLLGLGGAAGAGYYLWKRNQAEAVAGSDSTEDDTSDEVSSDESADSPTDDDIQGLGRALASEASTSSGYSEQERQAIAHCALNIANHRGVTVASIMLPPHHQYDSSTGKNYWCSTANPPADDDVSVATDVLTGKVADLTNGANTFFEPAVQDKLFAAGHAGYKHDAQGIRDKWTADGMELKATIGRWEFWGKA